MPQLPKSLTTKPASYRQGRKKLKPDLVTIRPMEAIHCGWEAMEALYRYRAMQSRHMAQLLFLDYPDQSGNLRDVKAAQQAANRNCLRHLKNRQFVKVIDAPVRKDDRLMPMELNILTPMGFQALQTYRLDHGLEPLPNYEQPAPIIFDRSFEHWFKIMETMVSAEAAVRLQGGVVHEYWDEHDVRKLSRQKHDPLGWSGLEPDAVMVGKLGHVRHAFLLEIDMGTEPVQSQSANSIRSKVARYREFFKQDRSNDPRLAEVRHVTLHVVGPSEARIETIREEVERQAGGDSFWFSTFEWTQLPYSFLGQVWQVSQRPNYHSPMVLFKS